MDSFEVNRRNWDERMGLHATSEDYALDSFRDDGAHLSDVVRFDIPRLGDITGLRTVHLQCHIGTDTLSLARLGGRVTGLDFSAPALEVARDLAQGEVDYVHGDVYSAVDLLGREQFDLVYTGIGAIGWLPSIDRWAGVVSDLLVPGGRLFIREGHPVLWALDYQTPDKLVIEYPYFETEEPLIEDEDETYVATEARLVNTTTHSWNHGLGEIITALLEHGLQLTHLVEHDSVPWNPLGGEQMVKRDGEWYLVDRPERLPLTYTLQAIKR